MLQLQCRRDPQLLLAQAPWHRRARFRRSTCPLPDPATSQDKCTAAKRIHLRAFDEWCPETLHSRFFLSRRRGAASSRGREGPRASHPPIGKTGEFGGVTHDWRHQKFPLRRSILNSTMPFAHSCTGSLMKQISGSSVRRNFIALPARPLARASNLLNRVFEQLVKVQLARGTM